MCLCIGERFSNKGPALLLCWSPASLPLLVQCGQAAAPPARQSPAQVGIPATPHGTCGQWPAGLEPCLSVPVNPSPSLSMFSSLCKHRLESRHCGPQPPGWLWPPQPFTSSPEIHTASLVAQLVENPPAMWETWFNPWIGKIPWRRERLPTPVFGPGEFHGLYSPWGHKESDRTERTQHTPEIHTHLGRCLGVTLASRS